MEENAKGNKIYIIISIIALLLVSILSIYLVFFNGSKEDKGRSLELYRYELYNGDLKYFTEKLDANKIGLNDTISYKCEKDDCSFLKSLYTDGNITDTYVALKDGKKYILYEYAKSNKRVIEIDSNIDYVQFLNDNYVLFIEGNKYYAYNIKDNTLSNSFKSDLLITNDGKPGVVLDNNIITIDNGKYGLVNLDTGNSIYDNEYTSIKCNKKSCLLSVDNKTNLYGIKEDKVTLIAQDLTDVLYYDNDYCVYLNNEDAIIYNTTTNESKKLNKFDKSYTINKTEIKDDTVTLELEKNNKCTKVTFVKSKGSTEDITCESDKLRTDIYVSSYNKAYITVKHETKDNTVYDLKLNNEGILYDNTGVFYDMLTLKKDYKATDDNKGVVVKDIEAYEFLSKYATKLGLKAVEKEYFINRFMNVLLDNKTSLVNIEVIDENATYDDVTIISNVDTFRYVKVTITKVDDNYTSSTKELDIPEMERKGLSVVLISGLE